MSDRIQKKLEAAAANCPPKDESEKEAQMAEDTPVSHWSIRVSRHFNQYFLAEAKQEELEANEGNNSSDRKDFGIVLRRQSFIFRSLTNAFAMLITAVFIFRLALHVVFHWIPDNPSLAEKVVGLRFWDKSTSSAAHGNFDIWNESVRAGDWSWWIFIGGMALGAIAIGLVNLWKFKLFPKLDQIEVGSPIPLLNRFDKTSMVWSRTTATLVYGLWAVGLVFVFT